MECIRLHYYLTLWKLILSSSAKIVATCSLYPDCMRWPDWPMRKHSLHQRQKLLLHIGYKDSWIAGMSQPTDDIKVKMMISQNMDREWLCFPVSCLGKISMQILFCFLSESLQSLQQHTVSPDNSLINWISDSSYFILSIILQQAWMRPWKAGTCACDCACTCTYAFACAFTCTHAWT